MEKRKTFKKIEHLCLDKQIKELFDHGKWLRSHHLRFVFRVPEDKLPVQARVLFSVPKKLHRKAVTRNLIKRRLRESYRHHKYILLDALDKKDLQMIIGFVYSDENIANYQVLEKEMKLLFLQLVSRIEKGISF